MTEHDRTRLGAYALGALDPAEAREVAEHVAGCAQCRAEVAEFEELREFLGEVPPEAFLDGPPEGGDLLLQRTVQAVRADADARPAGLGGQQNGPAFTGPTVTGPAGSAPAGSGPADSGPGGSGPGGSGPAGSDPAGRPAGSPVAPSRSPAGLPEVPGVVPVDRRRAKRRVWLLAAAAVVLVAGALTGGIFIGRQTVDPVVATETPPPLAPGSRETTATDPVSNITMATTLEPRSTWSYVYVKVTGVPAGSACELVVVDKAGKGWIAGSWTIGEKGAREGARFGGGVLVSPDQVTSVQLRTLQGKVLASTSF